MIPDRWPEKVDRKLHPHIKPIGLISALIEAITSPGELVVDPAAGSFVVMHAAMELGREFIGCDIAVPPVQQARIPKSPLTNLTCAPLRERRPPSLSIKGLAGVSGAK